MFLKKPRASTDPRLRSLLQKAVRRGRVEIAEATARRVYEKGDKAWLRSRAVVVTFEEAWPLAAELRLDKELASRVVAVRRAAASVKNKDAAGLGALAWAFHEGDSSMMDVVPTPRAVKMVAEALNRPPAFFAWAESQCDTEDQRRVVTAAKQYLAAATWGWDKACILAGGLLATAGPLPVLGEAPAEAEPFEYWVALDKHTPQGKDAIRRACGEVGAQYRQVIWCGFYFESAVVNELAESPWFDAERAWRLRRAGLDEDSARELWRSIRPVLESLLAEEAEHLRVELDTHEPVGPMFARPGSR